MPSSRFAGSCFVLVALVVGARLAGAADEPQLDNPVVGKLHENVTRFLDRVGAGDTSTAFGDLLAGSQLADQAAALRSLVDKSKEIPDRYGAFRESEPIAAKRIGKDVVLFKYLFKCEKYPVVWYFTYYRDFARSASGGEDHWIVISVRFDTQLDALGS